MERTDDAPESRAFNSLTDREFERLLLGTRVYSRVHNRQEDDITLYTGTVRTGRTSILSQVSLSDVSILSFVALPIQVSNLGNRDHYFKLSNKEPLETLILNQDDERWRRLYFDGVYPEALRTRHGALGKLMRKRTPKASEAEPKSDGTLTRRLRAKEVLFVRRSCRSFSRGTETEIAGFRYLDYSENELFNIHGDRGDFWLATRQGGSPKTVGWIRKEDFV